MAQTKDSGTGGVKGFFNRAASSFQKGFQFSREWSYWLAQKGGTIGLLLASTSMVVLMPLIFEINREITVRRFLLIAFYISYFVFVRTLITFSKYLEDEQ
jgi:hypothetical protein